MTSPHSRSTVQLRDVLTTVGLALAGRAGARLASALGHVVSRDTLLRLVKAVPDRPPGVVRVLGVDDFAFRRGHRYGTVLIDLETRRPVEVFDGRDGDRLAQWLQAHPGVEVICRDRASSYADGARAGAPHAIQVADRFHLWQNLGQAVEKTVTTLHSRLADPAPAPAPTTTVPAVIKTAPQKKIVIRMREHYTAVQQLITQGLSKAAVARQLGLHPATVRKFANAGSVEELIAKTEQRAHLVDPYREYLHQRWNDGERNATRLFREIKLRGYPGRELAVQRYLQRFRHGRGHAPQPRPKPPTVREITAWIMTHPDHLPAENTDRLRALRRRVPELNRLTNHVREFAIMLTGLHGDRLDQWITTVERETLRPLASFARFLRRDHDAVRNGLSLPYNSGPVEGTINRLKMLKRQMFGRASLTLLRKRLLHT